MQISGTLIKYALVEKVLVSIEKLYRFRAARELIALIHGNYTDAVPSWCPEKNFTDYFYLQFAAHTSLVCGVLLE